MRKMRVVMAEEEFDLDAPLGAECSRERNSRALPSLKRALLASGIVWILVPAGWFIIDPQSMSFIAFFAIAAGVVILAAALLVVWPFDWLVPRDRPVWHPIRLALFGAVCGALFLFLLTQLFGTTAPPRFEQLLPLSAFGGGYGAAIAGMLGWLNRKSIL